jgi:hypothetical protein
MVCFNDFRSAKYSSPSGKLYVFCNDDTFLARLRFAFAFRLNSSAALAAKALAVAVLMALGARPLTQNSMLGPGHSTGGVGGGLVIFSSGKRDKATVPLRVAQIRKLLASRATVWVEFFARYTYRCCAPVVVRRGRGAE